MNNKKNPFMNKKLQDAVLKLISEEYAAHQLYIFSVFAANAEVADTIKEEFTKIAADEINDHLAELVKWCRMYGYDIPCSDTEFKKYADKKMYKLVSDIKKGQDAAYYIDEAIKSELIAIDSYKKVIEFEETCQFTDLQALLWHIYYDEQEHAQRLNTLKIAYDAGVNIINA